jgi:hypothetical protein
MSLHPGMKGKDLIMDNMFVAGTITMVNVMTMAGGAGNPGMLVKLNCKFTP